MHCILEDKYAAKLIINDVSRDLEINSSVKLHVLDHSERSKYGVNLVFEALNIISSDQDEAAVKTGIVLEWAEKDVAKGWFKSKAISSAILNCRRLNIYSERVGRLKDRLIENEFEYFLKFAQEDFEMGRANTKAIRRVDHMNRKHAFKDERVAIICDPGSDSNKSSKDDSPVW